MLRVFMPCFLLRSMSLHAYMFRSTCLGFYAMFPFFCSSFCFALMLGLCAHVLDNMSMAMLCSDLCACMLFAIFSASVHAYMLGFMFFHVYVLAFMPMPRSIFLHACVLRSRFSHIYMPGSMFLHARLFRSVLRPRLCLSCHVLL